MSEAATESANANSNIHLLFLFVAAILAMWFLASYPDSTQIQHNLKPQIDFRKPPTVPSSASQWQWGRRHFGAVAMTTVINAFTLRPSLASDEVLPAAARNKFVSVWFGSGCFWGRQYDFIKLEKAAFKRDDMTVTALSGYAGGTKAGPGGLNCYFGGPEGTLYEENGQAEVVQIMLEKEDLDNQFRLAVRKYFSEFVKLPGGKMIRQDPQDVGAAYRSVLGVPGGINSPLMRIVEEENVNRMVLKEGNGNDPDRLNVVWVMDTDKFPFYRAERYHQFHRGLGRENFEVEYLRDLQRTQDALGRIKPTGCPDI